jgi:Flp pilus assembly pilin Flp
LSWIIKAAREFGRDQSGASIVEYTLMLALITIVCITGMTVSPSSGDTIPNCLGEFREIRESKQRTGIAAYGHPGAIRSIFSTCNALGQDGLPTLGSVQLQVTLARWDRVF